MMMGKPQTVYLYPALLLYACTLFASAITRILVVLGLYTLQTCGSAADAGSDDDDGDAGECNDDEKDDISSKAALLATWIGLATALPQILVSPYMGRLADRMGRRLPAMLAAAGALVANLSIVVVILGSSSGGSGRGGKLRIPPELMILGAFLEGCTGTYGTFLMATSSYTADINARDKMLKKEKEAAGSSSSSSSSREGRTATDGISGGSGGGGGGGMAELDDDVTQTQRFAYLEAMLTLGIVVGPLLGAVACDLLNVDDDVHNFTPIFVVACLLLVALILYLAFIVPESLPLATAAAAAEAAEAAAAAAAAAGGGEGREIDAEAAEDGEELCGIKKHDQHQKEGSRTSSTKEKITFVTILRMAMANRPLLVHQQQHQQRQQHQQGHPAGTTRKDGNTEAALGLGGGGGGGVTMEEEEDEEEEALTAYSPRCFPSNTNNSTHPTTMMMTKTTKTTNVRLSFVSVAFMLLFGSSNSLGSIFALFTQRQWGWGGFEINIYVSCIGAVGTLSLLFSRKLYPITVRAARCLMRSICGGSNTNDSGGNNNGAGYDDNGAGSGGGNSDADGATKATAARDLPFMRAGALASMCFSLAFALFDCPAAAFAILPFLAVQLGAIPSYRNVYSSCFGPEEQASIFAAVSVLESVPSLVAPLVYNLVYSFTVKAMPTFVFYLIAATAAVAALLLFRATTTTITTTTTTIAEMEAAAAAAAAAAQEGNNAATKKRRAAAPAAPAAEAGGLRSPLLQGFSPSSSAADQTGASRIVEQ